MCVYIYIIYPSKKPSVPFPPGPLCYTLGAPGPGVPATACAAATAERGLLRAEGMKAGTAGTGLTVPLALICLRSATKMPWESMDYMGIPWGYHGDTMGIP
jgi:hypothetical protein